MVFPSSYSPWGRPCSLNNKAQVNIDYYSGWEISSPPSCSSEGETNPSFFTFLVKLGQPCPTLGYADDAFDNGGDFRDFMRERVL